MSCENNSDIQYGDISFYIDMVNVLANSSLSTCPATLAYIQMCLYGIGEKVSHFHSF